MESKSDTPADNKTEPHHPKQNSSRDKLTLVGNNGRVCENYCFEKFINRK